MNRLRRSTGSSFIEGGGRGKRLTLQVIDEDEDDEDDGSNHNDFKEDGHKLGPKTASKQQQKQQSIDEAMKRMERAKDTDIAFVMDATSSMGPHIRNVKKSIQKIVEKILETHEGAYVRLAIVAYRDILDGQQRVQHMDFVTDVSEFEEYLSRIEPVGGRDPPEDMAIGIQTANNLTWQNPTRVVFIVADFPCHGNEFHCFDTDDFPDGTPNISIVEELDRMRHNTGDCGTMSIHFGRIQNMTDQMVRRLNDHYNIPLQEQNFSSTPEITKAVTRSVSASIFNTITTASTLPMPSDRSFTRGTLASTSTATASGGNIGSTQYHLHEKKMASTNDNGVGYGIGSANHRSLAKTAACSWEKVIPVKMFRNVDIISVTSLNEPIPVGLVHNSTDTVMFSFIDTTTTDNATSSATFHLKRATTPFAEGGCRYAYHAQLSKKASRISSNAVILKRFKSHTIMEDRRRQYFQQMEISTIAHFLANEYNKSSARPKHCAKIKMLQTAVVEVTGGTTTTTEDNQYYFVEDPLPTNGTKFTRYCNNVGYYLDTTIDETLVRFMKFTYEITNHSLIVTDLQGVDAKNKYYLTDAAILSRDVLRFGTTNLGCQAMDQCIASLDRLVMQRGWKNI
eukprot:CAMPEP_0119553130 /NCGR_PEP_ID=MMETSP1352-20130426/5958_1 /TAXON_ID=265584 /ORGANISM="Stauroneis constricta, Strain CCMP1120" /LENGTH=622 /DNA_ID=CAMNT_0007599481 /DNA_START=4 /DNA_END=1872 /DNA_ORIENTATION=+